jgi:hypothetical protein
LARLHEAGFSNPDLYSKHVWIEPHSERFCVLDWQRSSRRNRVGWKQRCRDLAALNATVAGDWATPRERLACWRGYCSGLAGTCPSRVVRRIHSQTAGLLRRRRIRELRQPPLTDAVQQLVWLDGEALCVTPDFRAQLVENMPEWLSHWHRLRHSGHHRVTIPDGEQADLFLRTVRRPFAAFWSWLRGSRPTSPEIRQAGLIFRLQRFGVRTPRLLAVGQRPSVLGRAPSFLLTQKKSNSVPLGDWLQAMTNCPLFTVELKRRWHVIRATGDAIRRLHEAGCRLARCSMPFAIEHRPDGTLTVVLDNVQAIRPCGTKLHAYRSGDLDWLRDRLANANLSQTDRLRFVLAYCGDGGVTPRLRQIVRQVMARRGRGPIIRAWRACG